MPIQTVTLVDEPHRLEDALGTLSDLDPVGVDVERSDGGRYYRTPALIQVGGAGRVVLVDPLAVDDLAALHDFLAERTVVLHAMENDLTPLAGRGIVPDRVEDTGVAAMLLGLPTGLDALLGEVLGLAVEGDKREMQRADWEARPLSEAMQTYAAGDVAELPRLWSELAAQLTAAGRDGWYAEEVAARRTQPAVEDRRDWTKVRGADRLDPQSRARLRDAWLARERCAQETDTAPGRVVTDRVLLDLAQRPARSRAELGRRGMRSAAVRRFGDQLLSGLADGDSANEVPPASVRVPTDAERSRADLLRAVRTDRAAALGLDPGVLCPSRTLLGAVMAEPSTPAELRRELGLRAWQWSEVGEAFCEALSLGDPTPGDTAAPHDQSAAHRYAACSSKEDRDG